MPKGYFHVGGQEKPQVEKRFYDAACQTKEDRQGEQAQDESRARFPDTRDVIGRERDHKSLGPAVRESLFYCGLCHGPIRASSRMLKKSASGVLTSLRGSTYRSVRLASSLAAALLDGHFGHPAQSFPVVLDVRTIEFKPWNNNFSAHS